MRAPTAQRQRLGAAYALEDEPFIPFSGNTNKHEPASAALSRSQCLRRPPQARTERPYIHPKLANIPARQRPGQSAQHRDGRRSHRGDQGLPGREPGSAEAAHMSMGHRPSRGGWNVPSHPSGSSIIVGQARPRRPPDASIQNDSGLPQGPAGTFDTS